MYAPVFKTRDNARFIFAYQDQLFPSKVAAELRGIELQGLAIDDTIVYNKEVIDISKYNVEDVVTLNGFALCFIDGKEKKNARGRRKKRNIP